MPELALRLCQPVHASSVRFMGHYNKIPDERLGFHRFFLLRVNGNLLAVLTQALETNNALNLGEQGVVLAAADVQARMDLRAALTDKDVARRNGLTVRTLDAQALGLGITAVLGRTYALFMREKL